MDIVGKAESTIQGLLLSGHSLIVAYSGGKDSTAALNLCLSAAAKLKANGQKVPKIIVTNADTGVENPEIACYVELEMESIRAFAAAKGLNVQAMTSYPALNDQWAVRIIGRRNLPTFANSRARACTIELKIKPMQKLVKKIYNELLAENGKEPVTIIGTRYDESASRAARMEERGESDTEVRAAEDGYLYLSPIANWTFDDVWMYLGEMKNGIRESYTDCKDLFRLYADGSGTS